ncbi:MAG: DNA-processing protein DprA [Firmicutes bacterium]|nr:DNA-processing protein DprA [Bacillota bacterium]
MSALKFWVWLTEQNRLGGPARQALLEHFGSPEEVYYVEPGDLLQVEGITADQVQALENKSLDRAQSILEECARKDIFLLTAQDALYPQRLKNIYDPPLLLYGRGSMPLFDEEAAVAVVGTRSCSPYGIRTAERFGFEMSKQGGLVVSGLARGIDAASQLGALRAGGLTAAVLGCGVDVVYPPENDRLYEDVAASGVLLSEDPPGAEPFGWHFPARNRILSGLCLATLVVEAPEKSGALITAATALEQGRDVFAIPGPLDAEGSVGCNRLIRDGAGLATESWDILREYQSRYPHKLHPDGEKLPPLPKKSEIFYPERSKKPKVALSGLPVINVRRNAEGLTDDQIKVLRILDDKEPMLTDDIALRANVPVRRILSAVTMLEIDGYTRQEGLRKFVRTVEVEDTKE